MNMTGLAEENTAVPIGYRGFTVGAVAMTYGFGSVYSIAKEYV